MEKNLDLIACTPARHRRFSRKCSWEASKETRARGLVRSHSRSQSFVPLDQRSENESSGSNHYERTKEITEFWLSGSLRICMPEMVAPRALVFRPLVKGNEALGTRLVRSASGFVTSFSWLVQRSSVPKKRLFLPTSFTISARSNKFASKWPRL